LTGTYNDTGERMLFKRIAEGDELAFGELFRNFGPKLKSYISRMSRSSEIADEMVQDIFLKLWLKRDTLTTVDYPKSWLYTMASNALINQIKHRKVKERVLDELYESAKEEPFGEEVVYRELKDAVAGAINALSPRRKQIYQMARAEGLPLAEIAGQLGISLQTVKNIMSEALVDIRQHLTKKGLLMLAMLFIFTDK